MKTWIALIRGINVGGRHKVPMKALVSVMEDNGFTDVNTYIQSGNVVFRSATRRDESLDRLLGRLIEKDFGFRPDVFLLTAADLRKAVDQCPYKPEDGKHLHFFFCDRVPQSIDTDFLDSLKTPTEEYKQLGKVFYLHTPDGFGRSKLVEKMGKAFPGVSMTARNLNTVNKLLDMAGNSA